MDFVDVMERVATVIEKNTGVYPYDKYIAESIGMSAPQYSNCKKHNHIPFKNIADFCRDNSITINWILYEQSSPKLAENDEEIFRIKRLREINASGGDGAYNDNAEYEYIYIDKNSASHIGINSVEDIEAINIIGDSMNPTLKENSIIIIDRKQLDFARGGIFVINTSNGLFVKRLAINPNGGIDLISDNKNYPVTTVSIDDSSIIGKVVGSLEKI